MFPVYGFMDSSNPHRRHHNGYQKAVPAYIPSKLPMAYESWPYGCNYGFPSPMPYAPSYHHGDVLGINGFRPSCPPIMPSPMPYYTPHGTPYYPEPYPNYYVPQMPRNDFEKDRAWSGEHHCCECPNHQKEDTSKRIQEQEQKPNDWLPLDMDKFKYLMNGEDAKRARDQKSEKRNTEEGDQMRRAPFPIIWMSPRYRREDELADKEGTEVNTSQKRYLGDGESFENSKASKEKDIPVNWIDPQKGEKKSEANENNSLKFSKLPPVCLRVDPLPKKDAKGRSRKKSSDAEISSSLSPESLDSTTKPEREKLSDLEAALRIQSAYRGYEIRRSRPLQKLKQISEIRKQMVDVRDGIQALESACGFREVYKQKLVLGETIMRLLLKLDTVQGLHPSLREARKSLAKELVILQEKLDSLVIDEKTIVEISNVESVDDVGFEGERNESGIEKQQESQEDQSSDENVIELGQDSMERFNSDENALVSEDDDVDDQVERSNSEAPFEDVCVTIEEAHKDEVDDCEEVNSATACESTLLHEEEDDAFDKEVQKESEEPLHENQIGVAEEDKDVISSRLEERDGQESMLVNSEMGVDRFVEENEKLRETMEKLIVTGQQQLNVIFTLSERVKNLEKKLSKKKNKHGGSRGRRSAVWKEQLC